MDKIKSFINEVIYRAALIFTIIVLFFSSLTELSDLSGSLTFWGLVEIFAFSLTVSWGLKLFKIKEMSFYLALILHFAITLFSAYVIFSIFGRIGNEAGMLVILCAAYAVTAIFASVIRHFKRRSINQDADNTATKKINKKNQPYKKQFK